MTDIQYERTPLQRRETVKEDGRRLYFYTFSKEDRPEPADRAVAVKPDAANQSEKDGKDGHV